MPPCGRISKSQLLQLPNWTAIVWIQRILSWNCTRWKSNILTLKENLLGRLIERKLETLYGIIFRSSKRSKTKLLFGQRIGETTFGSSRSMALTAALKSQCTLIGRKTKDSSPTKSSKPVSTMNLRALLPVIDSCGWKVPFELVWVMSRSSRKKAWKKIEGNRWQRILRPSSSSVYVQCPSHQRCPEIQITSFEEAGEL